MPLAGIDQPGDHRDEARVQQGRQRAPRAVQTRRQFVRTGDRQAKDLGHAGARGPFMGGVTGRELRGDGDGGDAGGQGAQGCVQGGRVERCGLGPRVGVAARDRDHGGVADRLFQPGARAFLVGKADQDQRGLGCLPLDQRVGGKRRRQRGHLDPRRRIRHGAQHGVDGQADPDGQVGPRGQRLGLGQDFLAVVVEQDRVGKGAARVDAQEKCHARPVFCLGQS